MINCPIFISSSDSYSDLWPVFFDFFKRYWPEYDGEIVLNTELKTYQTEGLNIICTQVGKLGSFGKTFRAVLDKIKSDNLMLIMIDYIFMGKVNVRKLDEYFDFFKSNNLDSICLAHQNFREIKQSNNNEISIVIPPSNDMFSFQIAFWEKSMLYYMALPHENPWSSEWYGTRRANKMKIKLACLSEGVDKPIPYDLAGCLHKGKWLENAMEHLKGINYDVDFNKRGYYTEPPRTFRGRLKVKWMLVRDGIKGSYWDLNRR